MLERKASIERPDSESRASTARPRPDRFREGDAPPGFGASALDALLGTLVASSCQACQSRRAFPCALMARYLAVAPFPCAGDRARRLFPARGRGLGAVLVAAPPKQDRCTPSAGSELRVCAWPPS